VGAPPLVGRRDELTWLEQRLDDSLAGPPQVVLVSGEPGIGKSRLVRELKTELARERELCTKQWGRPTLDGTRR
jgi:predicted ATPase